MTTSPTLAYPDWKAPAGDGDSLIWPAPAKLLQDTHDNQYRLGQAEHIRIQNAPLPTLRIKSTGYGAGGRETPGGPNLLRLLVGEAEPAASDDAESIAVIETVIDDSSPQLLGYVSDLLLASGAWDVYRAAVQMKKGRTGVQLTVLCRPDLVPVLRDLIFRETTTIGLHWRTENKIALAREFRKVETLWGEVQIKIARWPSGRVANASPEYEDCRVIAEQHTLPLKQVMQEAMRIYAAGAAAKEL